MCGAHKARLILVTGRAVAPHSQFDDVGDIKCECSWFHVPSEIHEFVGLKGVSRSVHTFTSHFEPPPEECDVDVAENLFGDDDDDGGVLPEFYPNPNGYFHRLPDGVETRVRMRLQQNNRYEVRNLRVVGWWTRSHKCVMLHA